MLDNAYNLGYDAYINKIYVNPYENQITGENNLEIKALYNAWIDGYEFARDEENYRRGLADLSKFE
jgi:hypothetical protein